ncbi:MAG: hypothetical protein K9G67_12940 [Bacteroidales bacterium]|nr:hypothetical protein [Bacteroidales bacterium]MCF8352680.1 hypothetical protein [Bacteroidales bacterium]MCF8377257.1 hypothetical protein [Bacteroidales bacterium]MCF8401121.1 hypothetical protein [Bacteroidales bacterium]
MSETEEKLSKSGFLLSGLPTIRLDTFIDAAFAFATTMLVISVGTSQVPMRNSFLL